MIPTSATPEERSAAALEAIAFELSAIKETLAQVARYFPGGLTRNDAVDLSNDVRALRQSLKFSRLDLVEAIEAATPSTISRKVK